MCPIKSTLWLIHNGILTLTIVRHKGNATNKPSYSHLPDVGPE